MSKKILITSLVTLLFIGALIGGFVYLKSKKFPKDESKTSTLQALPKKADMKPGADVLYEDAAGFSFTHPKQIKVEDVTPDNNVHYTLLSLKYKGDELIIEAKDTTADDIKSWLKKDSDAPKDVELIGATTLGKLSAQQYKDKNKLYTITVDKGVLYVIKGPKDNGFWEKTHEIIVSTFAFAGSDTKTSTSAPQNIIYEEEEVIE